MTLADAPEPSAECFQHKYTSGNFISRRLIGGFFDALARAVAAAGPVRRVLEVACGEGISTQHLRRLLPAAELWASDIDARRAHAARLRNPGVRVIQESVERLSWPSRSFDLVVALEVIEHVGDPDQALREICRVSRHCVVCSVPREPLWRVLNLARLSYVAQLGNTPGHVNHWSARAFTRWAGNSLHVRQRFLPIPWTMIVGDVAH